MKARNRQLTILALLALGVLGAEAMFHSARVLFTLLLFSVPVALLVPAYIVEAARRR